MIFVSVLFSVVTLTWAGFGSNLDFYHTSDEIVDALKRLQCDGLSLDSAVDGNVALPVASVSSLGEGSKVNRVMYVFGEHARELISPEVGFSLVKALCSEQGKKARHSAEYKLILNANPISRRKIESSSDFCIRTNEDNVDLNRNYAQGWAEEHEHGNQTGVGLMAGKQMETFNSGSQPFSEPESRAVAAVLREFKPHIFVSVHSGTNAIMIPWDYTTQPIANRQDHERMATVASSISKDFCPLCTVGDGAATVGYPATGTSSDYAYANGASYSYTWEIYTDKEDEILNHMNGEIYNARKETSGQDGANIDDEVLDPQDAADALLSSVDMEAEAKKKKRSRHRFSLISSRKIGSPYDMHAFTREAETISADFSNEASKKCMRAFNPLTKTAYDSTVSSWTSALLALAPRVLDADKGTSTAEF
jgi:hypothetical protein